MEAWVVNSIIRWRPGRWIWTLILVILALRLLLSIHGGELTFSFIKVAIWSIGNIAMRLHAELWGILEKFLLEYA